MECDAFSPTFSPPLSPLLPLPPPNHESSPGRSGDEVSSEGEEEGDRPVKKRKVGEEGKAKGAGEGGKGKIREGGGAKSGVKRKRGEEEEEEEEEDMGEQEEEEEEGGEEEDEEQEDPLSSFGGSLLETLYGGCDPQQQNPKKSCKNDLLKVVDTLLNHRYGGIFAEPVGVEEAEDYDEVVKFRVDLGEIREKIEGGEIDSVRGLYWHVLLMFQDAFMYNAPRSDVVNWASQLKRLAVRELEGVVRERGGKVFERRLSGMK